MCAWSFGTAHGWIALLSEGLDHICERHLFAVQDACPITRNARTLCSESESKKSSAQACLEMRSDDFCASNQGRNTLTSERHSAYVRAQLIRSIRRWPSSIACGLWQPKRLVQAVASAVARSDVSCLGRAIQKCQPLANPRFISKATCFYDWARVDWIDLRAATRTCNLPHVNA